VGKVSDGPYKELSRGRDTCAYCGRRILGGDFLIVEPFLDNSDAYTYHIICWDEIWAMAAPSSGIQTRPK
jgi:hypothetical protein